MDSITVKRALDRDAIAEVTRGLILRIELVNLADCIVVERKPGAWTAALDALIRFGESFIDGAAAVNDDARPRLRVHFILLPSRSETRSAKQRSRKGNGTLKHISNFKPSDRLAYERLHSGRILAV